MKKNLTAALWGAFYADAYSLGTHWIYDPQQIAEAKLDATRLHDPMCKYHPGKSAGDFTHYGDQMLWLLAELAESRDFEIEKFAARWQQEMKQYKGYIDGASKHTHSALKAGGSATTCGSNSHDFSVVGRMMPLIYALDEEQLSRSIESHTNFTHQTPDLVASARYFHQLIAAVSEGAEIKQTIRDITSSYPENIQAWVKKGLAQVGREPVVAITTLGPACGVEGCFASVIYLLQSFDGFQAAMEANVKAGGDSAARGLVVGATLGACGGMSSLPANLADMNKTGEIKKLMEVIAKRASSEDSGHE